jgi:RNA polymerase sigma-70 factor (ECF subfamily)
MTPSVKAASDADDDFRVKLIELLPFLRAFARTLCGNRDGADDLAQDAIKTAWQKRHMFEPGTNLKAWLFTIQRNSYYSTYRRVWRQTEWNEAAMERRLVTEASQVAGLELTDLKRAMTLLPDEQREALILVGAGGFQYHEAAAICGCAVGTMKSRVSRARHTLTSLMDNSVRLPASKEGAAEAYEGIVAELGTLSAQPRRDATTLRTDAPSAAPEADAPPSTLTKRRA